MTIEHYLRRVKSFLIRHRILTALQNIDVRGVRFLASMLPGMLMPKPKGAMVLRTIYGFALRIDPVADRGVEHSLYFTGTYEPGTLAVMKSVLKPGETFVDVGANIGLMTLFAASCVEQKGRVIAFEPHPDTRKILLDNLELNAIENVVVSPFAVGREPGQATIYDRTGAERGSASLLDDGTHASSHSVEITTLDAYFQNFDGKISAIKFDIEGYEAEALKGAGSIILKHRPNLIVESSAGRANVNASPEDLYRLLTVDFGYTVYRLRGGKGRKSKLVEVASEADMPKHDNVFCFAR